MIMISYRIIFNNETQLFYRKKIRRISMTVATHYNSLDRDVLNAISRIRMIQQLRPVF